MRRVATVARTSRSPRTGGAIVAVLAVVACGANITIAGGVSTALIAAVVLLPVWLPSAIRLRPAKIALAALAMALLSGIALFVLRYDPELFSTTAAGGFMAIFAGISASIGVFVWAGSYLSTAQLGAFFAVGWMLNTLWRFDEFGSQLWKNGFSLPLTILVLCLLHGSKFAVQMLVLLVLAGVGFAQDSRSYSGFCVTIVLLSVFSWIWSRATTGAVRKKTLAAAVVVGAVTYAAFLVLSDVLLSGFVGTGLQTRTEAQLGDSGNLLLEGRPEWAATLGMMRHNPLGFGPGAIPSVGDFMHGAEGLATIGVSGFNDYYANYTFGGQFRLHSVIADFWANFGPVGLVVAAGLLVLFVRFLLRTFNDGEMVPFASFIAVSSTWFLLFGPLYSNYGEIAFGVALVLLMSGHADGLSRSQTPFSDVKTRQSIAQSRQMRSSRIQTSYSMHTPKPTVGPADGGTI
jgi:hypothetical protein